MKRFTASLIFTFLTFFLSAQEYLPLAQIAPFENEMSGRDLVWNFSRMEALQDAELKISYSSADSCRVHLFDGKTHYYLHISSDSIFMDGYENRTVRASYNEPELWTKNLLYGDSCRSEYTSFVEYSHQTRDSLSAQSCHTIDGTGLIILLDVKTVGYRAHHHRDLTLYGKDTTILSEDTYLWYASGCKWPAVVQQEVSESINSRDSVIMRNAWYIEQEGLSIPANQEEDVASLQQGPISALSHYPNPVESAMWVCYTLTSDADVNLILTTSGGLPLLNKQLGHQPSGEHVEPINMGAFPRGTYELRIVAGGSIIGETVIKL